MIQAGILGCLWNIGIGGCKRMLVEFQRQSDACKAAHLRDSNGKSVKQYHYLYFIATDFPARGKGLASEIIRQWQDKATEDNMPIWLEATTPRSRDVYAKQGFKVMHEMRLGVGSHSEQGLFVEKGENAPGVPLWAMMWWPENTETGNA
jgi:GNAT superfamily N-acetyltransferase